MSGEDGRSPGAANGREVGLSRIPLLWKTSLYATFECLAAGAALPALERRRAEDRLGESLYEGTPAPEQQLLALAHTLLSRGLFSEEDLARRISAVRSRLEAA
jgi:hypothetical protein